MGYKKKTITSIGWMGLLQAIVKGLALVRIAILAKILSPYDIGLFSISLLLLGLLETFSEFGISTFVIQNNKKIKSYINTAYIIQIFRGIFLSLILIVIAFPAAIFFNDSEVLPLILLSSLIPIIKSLENPFIFLLQKNLQFGKEFTIRSISSVIDVVLITILAIIYQNAASVILALICSTSLYVVISWFVADHRPSFRFNKVISLEILKFARSISFLGIVTYSVNQIDSFIIGRTLGVHVLGGYQVVQKFSYTPLQDISSIVGKVTFPIYSKFRSDKRRLRNAYLKSVTSLAAIEFIIFIFLLIFSELILKYFADESFVYLSNILRLLALYGLIISIWGSIGSLFFALKKQKILILITLLRLMLLVPLIVLGVYTYALYGIVIALIISMILILPLSLYFVLRELR